ncbi:Nucleolar protein 14 [Varanus komodoensis]|nr:Nucleolar protein 14 [Varanus komodoensis]
MDWLWSARDLLLDGKLNIGDDEDETKEGLSEREDEESDTEAAAIDPCRDCETDKGSIKEARARRNQKKTKESKKLQNNQQNALGETAKVELPYLFDAPESYEQLKALLWERTMEEQLLVIERIQKSNHPSLAVGNKAKLEKLFGFLLDYVGELARKDPPELKTIDKLVLILYDLCQMFPKAASNHVKLILQDATHDIEEILEVKSHARFPGLDMLIYLKIIAVLFPTSDFWHPVITPSLLYMSQLLIKCSVTTLQDIAKGLFVCCLLLEYVSLSQRFIPELVNFLLGILHMAIPKKGVQGYTLVHPFGSLGKHSELLVIHEKGSTETWQKQNLPLHIITRSNEDDKTEVHHLRDCLKEEQKLSLQANHLLDLLAFSKKFCLAILICLVPVRASSAHL